MIRIVFDVRHLPADKRAEWRGWKKKARQARDEIIKAYEDWKEEHKRNANTPDFRPEFKDNVWKGIRKWLLENIFYGKCAYCETPIVGFRAHAEHFRPKSQVRFKKMDEDNYQTGKVIDEEGNEVAHPGYFWLAYNWKNLLPSCHYCNAFEGKKDQFPVKNPYVLVKQLTADEISRLRVRRVKRKNATGIFYLEPEDLNALEEPLILNPYFDDPNEHLLFSVTGKVVARKGSEKGKHTIAVFDLNDKDRVRARIRAQRAAWDSYTKRLDSGKGTPMEMRMAGEEALVEYRTGEAPYAAAALEYIHRMTKGSPIDPYISLEEIAKGEDEYLEAEAVTP